MEKETILTPAQLAERWQGIVSTGTLANWRHLGRGPTYTKLGRQVGYYLSVIEAYERENTIKAAK